MSMKRIHFFMKLMKLLGKGHRIHSSRKCLAQLYEQRKLQELQCRSLSSQFGYFEPMPTILEEDESAFTY
ncbi:unnamed protein product [Cylicocyclus nassatus]|uniref:Uncharacterized protein n=1 Tax=Cylicocyclus nassatus TaxID=53992 RepID=A0AA36GJ05_CYLNA|nr:unnamed protein product [Cylicocyclus nassatus]